MTTPTRIRAAAALAAVATLALTLALALVVAPGPRVAAQGGAQGPDLVEVLNDFFADSASEETKRVLGWTKLPEPVTLGDALGDHFPTNPGGEGFRPPSADLTGVAMAFVDPLDAPTVDALFGQGGPLAIGAPGVHYPSGYQIDPKAFANGIFLSLLVPVEPRGARPESFIAAVEGYDPRYPGPTGTVFQGTNKAWRYSVTPQGADVDYRQFDGAGFPPFRTSTLVVDTCVGGSSLPALDPCGYLFFTATSGAEVDGIESVRGELFLQEGAQAAADRNGSGQGEPIRWADIRRRPGTIGILSVAAGEAATDDDGFPIGPVVLIVTGAAAAGGGLVVLRRRRVPAAAAAADVGPNETRSAISYIGGPEVASSTPRDDDAVRTQWELLLYNEEQIQARLLEDYRRIATQFGTSLQTIGTAMATYEQGFQDVAWQSQWLAGVAAENKTALKVTTGIDLVLGIADAAPTIYSFGVAGWNRVFGATDEAVEVVTDVAGATGRGTAYGAAESAIAAARIADSPELANILAIAQREGNRLDAVFTEAAVLADRAGIDFAKVAPTRFDGVMGVYHNHVPTAIETLWLDMAEAAAQAKGFVRASDETAGLITTVTTNVRGYCNGGVVGSLDELRGAADGLTAMAGQPGFWDTVPNLYTVVGGPGSNSADIAVELLQHGDDLAFMQWMTKALAEGHTLEELPGLYQTLRGPVAAAGQDIAEGLSVTLGAKTLYSTSQGINTGMHLHQLFNGPITVSSVMPDGVTYLSQYGILRPTFLGMEAGDSAPWTIAFNALNGAGGFSTWLTGFRASIEGGLLYDDARAEIQPSLQAMAGASLDLVNALEVIAERVSTDSISNDDRRALRGVLNDMTDCVNGAGPGLRAELQPVLDARRAHIEAKLAQLEAVQGAVVAASQELPNMASTLDGVVNAGRDSIEWADPALREGFVVATGVVNALGGGVLNPPVVVTGAEGGDAATRDR